MPMRQWWLGQDGIEGDENGGYDAAGDISYRSLEERIPEGPSVLAELPTAGRQPAGYRRSPVCRPAVDNSTPKPDNLTTMTSSV